MKNIIATPHRAKRVLYSLLVALLTTWTVLWVGAAHASVTGVVVDEVDALSTSEERAISKRLTALGKELNIQFAVYFTSSPGSATIADYAEEFYDQRNLGEGSYRDGILLTVAVHSRETDIYLHGIPYKITDPDAVEAATDRARPHFAQGEWADGVNAYIDVLGPAVRDGLQDSTVLMGHTPIEIGIALGAGVVAGGALMASGESIARRRMVNMGVERRAAHYVVANGAVFQRNEHTLIDEDVDVYDLSDSDSSSSSSGSSGGSWSSSGSSGGHYSSRF